MKDIPGYEGLYAIEEDGRVWSYKTNKYIKQWIDGHNGYYMVRLHKNKIQTNKCIHRLLAEVYIPNPENYPTVDHIDQNRLNNSLTNLRWASWSIQNNNQDRTTLNKISSKRCKTGLVNPTKSVKRIDKNNNEKIYESMADGAEDVCGDRNKTAGICMVCKGIKKHWLGYRWEYITPTE